MFFKNGEQILPSSSLWESHQNHVHAALRPGAALPVPEEPNVPDDPQMPNIEGPLSFHPIANERGEVLGYYIFSTKTGELHTFGSVPYLGRSEDLSPG